MTRENTPRDGRIPAFEAVARDLAAFEVDTVFGLIGEDSAKLVSCLANLGLRYLGARHENTCVAMAEGYARVTGRPGVCILSRGPGFTNCLTAAVNAAKAGSPILILLGDSPTRVDTNRPLGPEYKAFDESGVGSASGLKMFSPQSPESVRPLLRDAFEVALWGNVAAISIPIDLMDALVQTQTLVPPRGPTQRREPAHAEGLAFAVEALFRSRRPLILAGRGACQSGARGALVELAERSGALLGTSFAAKDFFRGHRFNLGIIGTQSHHVCRDLVSQADLVLVFGAALTQLTTTMGETFADARIVHVDTVRANIGRFCHAEIAVVGDARTVAEQLFDALPEGGDMPFHSDAILHRIASFEPAAAFEEETTEWTVDPRTLMIELDSVLPEERVIACDIGNFLGFVGPNLSVPGPDYFHYLYDFSAIGLGFGLAMGVAVGKPELPVVLLVGDGALMMTLGELETAIRCDLRLIIVVMNDAAYGAERHYLQVEDMPWGIATYPDVDFSEVAAAWGLETATVRTVEDLRDLAGLLRSDHAGILIDCKVTPSVGDPVFAELVAARRAAD
jgi:thiamine pyrophosphate-dependent acetolactate synthase large subunit-like protein